MPNLKDYLRYVKFVKEYLDYADCTCHLDDYGGTCWYHLSDEQRNEQIAKALMESEKRAGN